MFTNDDMSFFQLAPLILGLQRSSNNWGFVKSINCLPWMHTKVKNSRKFIIKSTQLTTIRLTGPRNTVVRAPDYSSESLGFESYQPWSTGSALGPMGRLEPHSWGSSTSWMSLWNNSLFEKHYMCCSSRAWLTQDNYDSKHGLRPCQEVSNWKWTSIVSSFIILILTDCCIKKEPQLL